MARAFRILPPQAEQALTCVRVCFGSELRSSPFCMRLCLGYGKPEPKEGDTITLQDGSKGTVETVEPDYLGTEQLEEIS